ncbi:MAG: helix-turn-helix transcriptional regulator [Dehalococcoidia bacterium]|nr:helix-turn-helix transcriptional regulator [Dehalococcoidia bacterium]
MPTQERVKKQARPRPSSKPLERGPRAKVPAWDAEKGAVIRAARVARGLTMGALGKLVSRCGSRIGEVERAEAGKGPNAALLNAIMEALDNVPAAPSAPSDGGAHVGG